MKKMYVALVNGEFKSGWGADAPMFLLYLGEIPNIGDELFIADPENYAGDEQFADLYSFCKENLPKQKTSGFLFKVSARGMMRCALESWWLIDLIYVPGIHDTINIKNSVK